ncbi:unnamed protein product [Mytilus edulis]|uniref:Uncharacterized protein n=1 Tax=Mytilus edulis TaxID=6550 RepID=A0A8S3SSV2_MYTED|nr:unnamed protein product [Mytilus edulis]
MDPDIENSVKRIVGEEIRKTQNDLLSQMEGMFSIKLQEFDHQQKERSELQMSRLQNELSGNDDYKFQRKSCEDQFKFNRKLSVTLKEADASLESRDPSASLAKQKIAEDMELIVSQNVVSQMTLLEVLNSGNMCTTKKCVISKFKNSWIFLAVSLMFIKNNCVEICSYPEEKNIGRLSFTETVLLYFKTGCFLLDSKNIL